MELLDLDLECQERTEIVDSGPLAAMNTHIPAQRAREGHAETALGQW